jgi:hypothetical protein
VSQECVTYEEQIRILAGKSAFMDNKVAFVVICPVKILLWLELEDVITHLEANWFDLLGN